MEQVASLGLIVQMRRIPEVRRIIRYTLALPLLPENLIMQGFRVIMQHARDEGNFIFRIVQPFLRYIWRNWVSRPWRRTRMSVFGSYQRTNNVCESHNRTLREAVGTHQNLYSFIGLLIYLLTCILWIVPMQYSVQCSIPISFAAGLVRLEQRSFDTVYALDNARRVMRGRRRSSIMNDNRIANVTQELFNPPGVMARSLLRFLRIASHTMDEMLNEVLQAPRRGRCNQQ